MKQIRFNIGWLVKISFLCSGLEEGRDGVGDYTRHLAAECIRQGHQSIVLSLNDPQVPKILSDSQASDGSTVSVLRLPDVLPWKQRMEAASDWLDAFGPDWISLQFVPFGFHRNGLCFGLGKRLTSLNSKAAWHVMFHELWLGLNEDSPIKHRFVGALQQRIIMALLRRLRPQIVHTQTEPYRKVLDRNRIKASILPLFSNIRRVNQDAWEDFFQPLLGAVGGKPEVRSELYLTGVFGAVHPEWNAELTIDSLLGLTQRFQKRLVVVFFGNNNLSNNAFTKLKSRLRDRAVILMAGERSSSDISKIIQTLDLGLATSPRQIVQKSGSVAAMLEHGLQVLVTRDDWKLRGTNILHEDEISPHFLLPKQLPWLKSLPTRNEQPLREYGLKRVVRRMLISMA